MTKQELLGELEACAAGCDYRSTANRKDLAEQVLALCADRKISTRADRYHHLCGAIRVCNSISNADIRIDTYTHLVTDLLDHWDVLGTWTWPYRVLVDVVYMDVRPYNKRG